MNFEKLMKEIPRPGIAGSTTFRERVEEDLYGNHQPNLRFKENVDRWLLILHKIEANLEAQFSIQNQWRKRAVKFQSILQQRIREAENLSQVYHRGDCSEGSTQSNRGRNYL
jgi:hypothetical protein